MNSRPLLLVLGVGFLLACASDTRQAALPENYLRYSSFELVNEDVLLRWPTRKMPLKVHLGEPPAGHFEHPEALMNAVRDGVTDWTGVAAPGVPSFEFVEDPGDADIPVVREDADTSAATKSRVQG